MSTSKTGKHGHAKVNLTGIDVSPFKIVYFEDDNHVGRADLYWQEICKLGEHLVGTSLTYTPQEDISPSTHNMDVPNVRRNEYQLVCSCI